MTDNAVCYSLVRGRSARVTKLDACGSPVLGPTSQVVTKGVITVTMATQTDSGTTIAVVNANGETCVRDVPPPIFLGFIVEIALCGVDPDLVVLLTGQPVVKDDSTTPLSTGFKVNSKVSLDDVRFALELWSGVDGAACTTGAKPYGYFLLPLLQGGSLGDVTWQNDAINFTVSGAATKDDNAWGVGPYNIRTTALGAASPLLEALDPDDHLFVDKVNVAPPTPSCGAIALGVPATGAVAGLPGHYAPTNSYGPANVAALIAGTPNVVVASPTTAWTTGQYITTRDGAKAHWNATAWVAGAA